MMSVAAEKIMGESRGNTQDFCFAGRTTTQQGAGKDVFVCPVHKLLWWLLKCLNHGSVLRQQCKLHQYASTVPL